MKKIDFNSKSFLLLLVIVTICFLWVVQPFLSAIFWACILAIAFWPVHRWISHQMSNWPNFAALCSLIVCTLLLVLPLVALSIFLVQEVLVWYQNFNVQNLDMGEVLTKVMDSLPNFIIKILEHFNLYTVEDVQQLIIDSMSSLGGFLTSQAISLSQNALNLSVQVVLIIYLLFFLFRDGLNLKSNAIRVIPLDKLYAERLAENFTTVVLATVKGTLSIAVLQGVAGGVMLYLFNIPNVILLSVAMALLALLPIVGASLVWGPIAIYFLATGQTIEGVTIIAIGTLLIGTLDNLVRPLLVGKGTKLPDYVVLLSTIGGMYLFGFVGFILGPAVAALFVSVWTLFGELQVLKERARSQRYRPLNNKYTLRKQRHDLK